MTRAADPFESQPTIELPTMLLGSRYHTRTCEVCAEICAACAKDCERLAEDDTMQRCAETCRRCSDSCRQMAKATA
jgi:hypothetical protein